MRPLLFYSAWPLGYHNPEAERKARAFAAAGYDTVYVAGIGIRNPTPATLGKAADRLVRGLTAPRRGAAPAGRSPAGLRDGSLLVVPPRQLAPVRRGNARWVRRRLERLVGSGAVMWVRWPTPELVDALPALRPAAVVYECVDAYELSPGMTGRWLHRHEAAERALVALADAVVVPSEHLAERFRGRAAQLRVVPHGVDLARLRLAAPRERDRPPVIGFVGTLDYRLDLGLVRYLAARRPEWSIRLIGPVQEGFDRRALADLPNVSVEAPVAHDRLGTVLASFDAGLMPYSDAPVSRALAPVKNLEIMAVGRPAVARRLPALEPYADLLELATTPEEFLAGLDRALAADSRELARLRRERAEAASWDRRLESLLDLLRSLNVAPDPSDERIETYSEADFR